MFKPKLDKEFKYNNDDDDERDKKERDEKRDEKVSESLERYWNTIKSSFYNSVILPTLNLVEWKEKEEEKEEKKGIPKYFPSMANS